MQVQGDVCAGLASFACFVNISQIEIGLPLPHLYFNGVVLQLVKGFFQSGCFIYGIFLVPFIWFVSINKLITAPSIEVVQLDQSFFNQYIYKYWFCK